MSIPTLDEQFLPRLLAIFYAVFHPTEGPKVIYQVPEGSITEECIASNSDPSSSKNSAGASKAQSSQTGGALGGEPLFDFSALSEYLIPKAPLCGRLVTSIARGTVAVHRRDHQKLSRAPSVAAPTSRSASVRPGSSRGSSVQPRSMDPDTTNDPTGKPQREQRSYKILGFPTLIEDAAKYQRNNFIFNLCFVFDGASDVRAYEPVVRKCGRVLRGLEETQSFLTSPKSLPRMYGIIEQLFEDLSSYCESFVALPEAPYTSYLTKTVSKPNTPELHNLISPVLGPEDFISLGASFASLRGEHHRTLINERLKQKQREQAQMASSPRQMGSPSSTRASPVQPTKDGPRSRSGSASGSSDSSRALTPLTAIRGDANPMMRSNSASGMTGPGSDGPHSPPAVLAPGPEGRRPSLGRSSTVLAVGEADSGQAALRLEESRDTAMGIVSSKRHSELSRELSAAESLGNVLTSIDSGAYDSINTVSGTRRSSRGSNSGAAHHGGDEATSLEQLAESIVSLRTIDAALSNSVNALRTDPGDTTRRTALVEKREPPHGLGRTVRDAINLKLFPVYPNPPPINDWDVPVALLDLLSRVDGNWDLTLRRILPFIDGVNHVKRIAQLADADLGLTRACLEHLVYYGCIIVVDIFQYFNMYTVRPAIAKMADDEALGRECATYVTRSGYSPPSYPEILRLYSLLRAGTTLHDWVEDNDIDAKGIDVRRFVSFGVIQGFLRRIHRYPIFLGSRAAGEEGGLGFDNSVVSTVRNSPVINSSPLVKSNESRRDQSVSREPRDRRPRELSGMSGAYSAFQRIGRDGSVDSPGVGTRTPVRRGASEARLSSVILTGNSSAFALESSIQGSGGGSQFGTSPTKRLPNRPRQRPNYRHPTTTAMDVASVAFQANDSERPWTGSIATVATTGSGTARSPRKRASAIGLGTNIPTTPAASSFAQAGAHHQAPIPSELVGMLDGTRSDDELCVHFSISWPELERFLIRIGHSHSHTQNTEDSEEDDLSSTNKSDWRRWGASASGWSKGRMSGFSGKNTAGLSGIASSGRESKGDSSGWAGAGSGWGADVGDESGLGWAQTGSGAVDREAVEAGDLGRVRILYQ